MKNFSHVSHVIAALFFWRAIVVFRWKMLRARETADDADVAEFDCIVLKGRELKRLLPGEKFVDVKCIMR